MALRVRSLCCSKKGLGVAQLRWTLREIFLLEAPLQEQWQLKFPPATPPILPPPSHAHQNALNLADMRYGLAAEELEVGEIFVTKGKVVKRIRIMGRGRAGISR